MHRYNTDDNDLCELASDLQFQQPYISFFGAVAAQQCYVPDIWNKNCLILVPKLKFYFILLKGRFHD